jgi:hypothetical protein
VGLRSCKIAECTREFGDLVDMDISWCMLVGLTHLGHREDL